MQYPRSCRSCNQSLPEESFPFLDSRKKYRRAICRACDSKRVIKYNHADPVAARARWRRSAKTYMSKDPWAIKLRNNYNLTVEEYEEMGRKQNYRCAICNNHPEKVLCVDHDHKTKAVRSLLCNSCNLGLGFFKDNITYLNSAVDYLTRSSEVK